MKHYDIRGREQ